MFAFCADPKALQGLEWATCYLTSGKHINFYWSFVVVLALLAVTAPIALGFGFAGAMAARSHILPLRWLGKAYIAMVRGVPDIVYFLFFVIALDQGFEYLKNLAVCPLGSPSPWQGMEFRVCADAKVPLATSSAVWHQLYGLFLAMITFAIVFGAFAGNVLFGAMKAVPHAQLETGEAFGLSRRQTFWRILVPQMWIYALPGLGNLWMILIKASPLLFLLGVRDIVYWAKELGGTKTQAYEYPHSDLRIYYLLGLLEFFVLVTWMAERFLGRLTRRLSHGQATVGGDELRNVAA
jgi:polar amino acid transport system permease protein